LTYGLDSVKQTAAIQRTSTEGKAALLERDERVPETRLSMDPGGLLTIKFTIEVKVTDEIRKRFN